jgi:hypothetical protein
LENGSRPNYERFHEVPVERRDLLESLKVMVGKEDNARLPVSQDYGGRFLAKLGLGFGGLFLEPASTRGNRALGDTARRDTLIAYSDFW